MQSDIAGLEKKAIKAAVASDWPCARDINLEILKIEPANLTAKIRLGKAYLELKEFAKAKKFFREVLGLDPINTVALRNLEFAKEEKRVGNTQCGYKNIIKEPATSCAASINITAKGITASRIPSGLTLELKILSGSTKVFGLIKDNKIELGAVTDDKVHKKLKAGKDQGANFTADFVKGADKNASIIINATMPIFDGERQDVKPYTKRDFTDSDSEPELVIEEN
ncbi:hypothetical protein A2709_02705 [candidate division WWE3 bacterium RIFCSPHIGHO2_01_FULL_43_9]|uniref:Uncharacterized protein n=1 Tax=candidate division WWE3 bacterium RIFCSPHIGHO2_01_FULL_43_9 TaxID=1802618 RepID=A0A1F4V9D0_UNCKA|nr:MAG: hypothetical protein A2709_02705 [candidate division WWE3 bacterium RIFCSPHIGHO2_01_FULL_43_9]